MDTKSKLLAKNRKIAKSVDLAVEGGTQRVDIVKPTMGDRLRVLDAAQKAGELDADGKPTSQLGAAKLGARVIVALVHVDGQPVFGPEDVDDLLNTEFFESLSTEVFQVFSPDYEQLKGNS